MKITKLKTHVKCEYLDKIYILPYESFYALHLSDIESIDKETLKKMSHISDRFQAKEIALKALKTPKTQYEIKQKLTIYSQDVVVETINFLKQYHYIDDLKYMQWYSELKRSYGKKMLSQRFKEKGIQFDLVEAFLKSLDESKRIIDVSEKIIKSLKGMTIKQKRIKLQEKLYRFGFSSDAIQSMMTTISVEKEDESKLLETLFLKKKQRLKGTSYEKCQTWIKYALSKGFDYDDAKTKCEDIK